MKEEKERRNLLGFVVPQTSHWILRWVGDTLSSKLLHAVQKHRPPTSAMLAVVGVVCDLRFAICGCACACAFACS